MLKVILAFTLKNYFLKCIFIAMQNNFLNPIEKLKFDFSMPSVKQLVLIKWKRRRANGVIIIPLFLGKIII